MNNTNGCEKLNIVRKKLLNDDLNSTSGDFDSTSCDRKNNKVNGSSSNGGVNGNEEELAELKIALPDKSICSLSIKPSATTDQIYSLLAEKINLDASLASYFYLFEVIDSSFGKLFPLE